MFINCLLTVYVPDGLMRNQPKNKLRKDIIHTVSWVIRLMRRNPFEGPSMISL